MSITSDAASKQKVVPPDSGEVTPMMEIKDTRIRAIFENTSSAPFLDQIKDVASYLASNHNLNDPSILELCREAYQRRGRTGIHFLQGVQFWLKRILEEKGVEVPVPVKHLERLVLPNSQGDSWTEEPDETEEEQDETEENDLRDDMPSDADDYRPEEEEEALQPLAENVISEYVHQESTEPFNLKSLFNGVDPFENRASGKAVPLQAQQNDPVTTSEPQAPADTSSADTGTRQESAVTNEEDDNLSILPTLSGIAKTYKPLDYFWYPWIPLAEITVTNGDGGVGKSYLNCAVAAYRAMRIPLPGDDRPYPRIRSLIINNEDHNDRILERMSSLPIPVDFKSDLLRFWPEKWKPFHATNEAHIELLEKMFQDNDIQALWLDSLESILPGLDINKDVEIVPKLRRLVALAKKYKIPVVINHHLNSMSGVKATQRSRGSKQVINISRSTLIVEKLYGEANDPTARGVSHAKVNYAPEAKTLTFHIVPQPERKAAFMWGSVKDITADQLMNQKIVGESELKDDDYRILEYLVEKAECQWLRLNLISAQFPDIPKSHLSGRNLKRLCAKKYVERRQGGEYKATEQGQKLVKGES